MLRNRAAETEFLARVGGTRCSAYGFFEYFALSLYMIEKRFAWDSWMNGSFYLC